MKVDFGIGKEILIKLDMKGISVQIKEKTVENPNK